jgi:hypothetical protein
MEPVEITATTFESPNIFADEENFTTQATFTDFALRGDFKAGKIYYFRFLIHRVPYGFYSQGRSETRGGFPLADNLDFNIVLRTTE